MKKFYDRKQEGTVEYKKGDKVWLEATNLPTKCPMKKLDNKCHSLFEVLEKIGKSIYRLKLPVTWKIYNIFNEVLLTPHCTPSFPSQQKPSPPPPEIINNKPEYIVEKILDAKLV